MFILAAQIDHLGNKDPSLQFHRSLLVLTLSSSLESDRRSGELRVAETVRSKEAIWIVEMDFSNDLCGREGGMLEPSELHLSSLGGSNAAFTVTS